MSDRPQEDLAPVTDGTSALARNTHTTRPNLTLVGGTAVDLAGKVGPDGLLPWHRDWLEACAIAPNIFQGIARSILRQGDLPSALQWYFSWGGGILFEHRTPDGTIECQYRMDRLSDEFPEPIGIVTSKAVEYEAKNGAPGKYVYAKGAAVGLWKVDQHDSEGRYSTTRTTKLIIEGTKGYQAVASWAPDDLAVIGIGGCDSGRKKDVGYVPAWAKLGIKDSHVVIALDGDVQSNPNVHRAGLRLAAHLTSLGAVSVRFATLPVVPEYDPEGKLAADTKRGADDVLCKVPEAKRASYIQAFVANAGELPPLPVEDLPGIIVDHEAGTIRENVITDLEKGTSKPGRKLMNAAVDIERVHITRNLVKPGSHPELRYDLGVTTAAGGDGVLAHSKVTDLTDAGLADTRSWLPRVEGGYGVAVTSRDKDVVLQGIRELSLGKAEVVEARAHTGWEEPDGDGPGYSDALGRVTAPDTSAPGFSGYTRQYGVLRTITTNTVIQQLAFPDVAAESAAFKAADPKGREGVHAAIDLALSVGERMVNPTGWDCVMGSIGSAFSGVKSRGAMVLVGKPGSGKTILALKLGQQMLGLHQGARSFKSTVAVVDAMRNGIHHGLLHVEDVKDKTGEGGKSAVEAQDEIVTSLLGMAYDGDSGQKNKSQSTADGWQEKGTDRAIVHVSLTAELDAIPFKAAGAIDRSLFVLMDRTDMTMETVLELEAIAENEGKLLRLLGGYLIAALAANIVEGKDATGRPHGGPATLEAYLKATGENAEGIVRDLMATELGAFGNGRLTHPTSRAVLGVRVWADAMRRAATVEGGEHLLPRVDRWEAEAFGRLVAAAVAWRNLVADRTAHSEGKILSALRDTVLAGRARLIVKGNFDTSGSSKPILGYIVKQRGGRKIVVLNIGEVAKQLSEPGKGDEVRKGEILRILDPILVRQGAGKQVKVAGMGSQYAITLKDWCDGVEDDNAEKVWLGQAAPAEYLPAEPAADEVTTKAGEPIGEPAEPENKYIAWAAEQPVPLPDSDTDDAPDSDFDF
ncbi:hypothetical protein [Sinomonas sp. RB5]